MNRKHLPILVNCLLLGLILPAFGKAADSASPREQPNLVLAPLFQSVTLDNGFGKLPFIIENKSSRGVMITPYWHAVVRLMAPYDSVRDVPVREFGPHSPSPEHSFSPDILLNPGTTGTFDAFYTIEAIDYLRSMNKRIYGDISGKVVGTDQLFKCSSAPFSLPPILTACPWDDMGKQNYFTITADTSKIGINPHKLESGIWTRGSVNVPVSIKNTSGRLLIAIEYTNLFTVPIDGKASPSYWTAVKATKPILQPGEFISSVCETDLDALEGYKPGDKVVVSVEGRVPNTNQVFRCFSAPFELPPLPKDKPPKGALQIPGL